MLKETWSQPPTLPPVRKLALRNPDESLHVRLSGPWKPDCVSWGWRWRSPSQMGSLTSSARGIRRMTSSSSIAGPGYVSQTPRAACLCVASPLTSKALIEYEARRDCSPRSMHQHYACRTPVLRIDLPPVQSTMIQSRWRSLTLSCLPTPPGGSGLAPQALPTRERGPRFPPRLLRPAPPGQPGH